MLTIENLYLKGIIKDDTKIYIHIENETLDMEFTLSGNWFQDHILEYGEREMDCMRICKDAPNTIYFNLYE